MTSTLSGRIRGLAAGLGIAALALATVTPSAWGSPLFSKLPGELTEARYAPVAAVLPSGSVLIAGGYIANGKPLKTAELFNPTAGRSRSCPVK